MKNAYASRGIALAAFFIASCKQQNIAAPRLPREEPSSRIEQELRQMHAQQRFDRFTITGTKLEEFFDAWIIRVYEIAPKTDGHLKLAPQGKIYQIQKVSEKSNQVTLHLNGTSPLEALNTICDTFNVYFSYTNHFGIIIRPTSGDLELRDKIRGDQLEKDPFASE